MTPAIFGMSGLTLTAEERAFFAEADPAGYIVFLRNIESREQLRALTDDLRSIHGRDDLFICVDQEGGRVVRLKAPAWWHAPAAGRIGKVADQDLTEAETLAVDVGKVIGAQLAEVGINVNLAPCLDVRFPYTHDAIGDRAFHADPLVVARLGRAYANGLGHFGVQAALKHLPGHGRAKRDSHHGLPMITAPRDELEIDLAPFHALADLPWGIVSHLMFSALDASEPATTSAKIIREIVRDAIGFAGLLVTDDIVMKALKAPVQKSALRTLEAGCDIICHCSADLAEMAILADVVAPMDERLAKRFEAIRQPAGRARFADVAHLAADIDRRLAGV